MVLFCKILLSKVNDVSEGGGEQVPIDKDRLSMKEQRERGKFAILVPSPGLKAGKSYQISMDFISSVPKDELRRLSEENDAK